MTSRDDSIDKFIKNASEYSSEAQAKLEEYRGRRGRETQLWQKWHQANKEPTHLTPLLKSMQPLIKNEANKRLQGLGGSIPRSAIENELTTAAVKQLHSYDPNRGVALTTHVTNGFRRISDFVNANRNAKYMPGADMKRFDAFRNASTELHDELGRPPSAEEIKQRLPDWSPKTIQRMQRGFGRELYTDMGDGLSIDQQNARMSPRDAFQLVRRDLNEQEQQFGAMYFPPEGEQQPAIKNIARALGVPPSRAYRIKARVEAKVGPILKKE